MQIIGQIAIRILWLGVGYMVGKNWEALRQGRKSSKSTPEA